MDVGGKLALVTGGSRGIGAAIALALARRGARVVLMARTREKLEAVAEQVRGLGAPCLVLALDLADADQTAAGAEAVRRQVGPPDILVNNAGGGRFAFTDETSAGEAAAMRAVPYLAAFNLTRAFLPAMLARRSGHVVNVTSAAAFCPIPGATAYDTACWAVRGFSEALRLELHRTGVDVTLLAAGIVDTPGFEHYPGVVERMPAITRIVPTLQPAQVARAVVRAIEPRGAGVCVPRTRRRLVGVPAIAPSITRALVTATGWTRSRVPPTDPG